MEKNELRPIIESLLFMSTEPLTVSDIKKIIDGVKKSESVMEPLPETDAVNSDQTPPDAAAQGNDPMAQLQEMKIRLEEEISKGEIKDSLLEMVKEFEENPARGYELVEVAKGFQFRTRPQVTPFVKALYKVPSNRLSTPGLETLAIVAYQQPVTRAKVEEIRGVESGGVLRTLLERDLVRVVGRSEEPGRPILYGTTVAFLEVFGLHNLSDLPTLKDLELLDQGPPAGGAATEDGGDITEPLFDEINEGADAAAEDETSHELIEDLENSLRSLRDLEKKIFEPENKGEEQSGEKEGS